MVLSMRMKDPWKNSKASIDTGMIIWILICIDIDYQYRCHKAVSEVEPETALSIIDNIIGIESFKKIKWSSPDRRGVVLIN